MSVAVDLEGAHLAALERLGGFRGRRVLEIGCGDGRLTRGIVAEASWVLAFDPNALEVEAAARSLDAEVSQGRVMFAVGALEELELPRGLFEIALFSWSY